MQIYEIVGKIWGTTAYTCFSQRLGLKPVQWGYWESFWGWCPAFFVLLWSDFSVILQLTT